MTANEMTYAAIITLDLPGMAQPATVTVTLTPADPVATASGRAKPLSDCTLADLEAFAGTLEEEIWARYQARQLIRLAEDEESHIKITVLEPGHTSPATPGTPWLEHAILLPPDVAPPAERPVAVEEDATPTDADAPEAPETGEVAPAAATVAADPTKAESESETEDAGPEPAPAPEVPVGGAEAVAAAPTADGPEVTTVDSALVAEAEPAPVAEPATAPDPVETPVVEGVEPTAVPTAAREAAPGDITAGIQILGLRRPVGHPTPAAVDILVNESAFRNAQEHALSSLDREVAGMLIGPHPEKQPDGRYVVHISDTIIAHHTRMAGASVTYTPESWRYVTDVLTERYPNEEAVIVGWYHTHPGFGIFLSGMDLFIHQNFFTQKWHVALVLDPRARRTGFFCWNRLQTAVQPYEFPWPPWAPDSW